MDFYVSYCNKGVGANVCLCCVHYTYHEVDLLEMLLADCSNMHGVSNVTFAVSVLHILIRNSCRPTNYPAYPVKFLPLNLSVRHPI